MATQINQDNWRYHLRRGITDLWFILSVSVALLLLFILLGYHNTDPGWSTSGSEGEIKHWFGATGAYISDALFSLTGYACYMLPLGLVLIGWQSTRRTYIDAELLGWKFFALFFSLVALAGILTLRGGAAPINSLAITAGGVIGQKMNIELLKIWSVPIIMMVYTALFVLGVTLMAEFPWLKMLERIGFYVTLIFRKIDDLDRDDGVTDRRKPTLQDEEISRRRRQNLLERVKVIDLDAQAHKEYAQNSYTPNSASPSNSTPRRNQPSFNLTPPAAGAEPSFNIAPPVPPQPQAHAPAPAPEKKPQQPQNYVPPADNNNYSPPPQPQNYAPPASARENNNYVPPQQPQNYAPPVENNNYAPPQQPQNYAPPVENNNYVPPQQPQSYAPPASARENNNYAPPQQPQNYAPPVENNNYAAPPQQPQNYAPPTSARENNNYVPPQQPQNYAPPVENNNYVPPQQPQSYAPPAPTRENNNYAPPPQPNYAQPQAVEEERSEPILSWATYKNLYENKAQNHDTSAAMINTAAVSTSGSAAAVADASYYPPQQSIPAVTTPDEHSAATQVVEEPFTAPPITIAPNVPTQENDLISAPARRTPKTAPAEGADVQKNRASEGADVQKNQIEQNEHNKRAEVKEDHHYVNYKPRHHIRPEAFRASPLMAVNDDSTMSVPPSHSESEPTDSKTPPTEAINDVSNTVPNDAPADAAPAPAQKAPLRVRLNAFQDRPTKIYPLPPLDLLNEGTTSVADYSAQELDEMAMRLENALKNYKVNVRVENIAVGPVVTRLELSLAAGVKVSQISNLEKDIARSLAVPSVRVVEVIAGKPFVGLEMPNAKREIVPLRGVLESGAFRREDSPLTMALGVDVGGKPIVVNLGEMPHLLVAGTTGSGKSVGINVMLTSMLFKSRPDDLKLILIDPKRLEMSFYEDIPHLLTPVITDMQAAENAFCWAVAEMERRFQLMAAMKVRKIDEFNKVIAEAKNRGSTVPNPFYRVGTDTPPTLKKLPYIVIVVDELADLMMVAGKNVEQLIARIAQKARAAGIHLILATQRPSVDVITGLIKSNIPARIAFQVSSKIDSRIILDNQGAGAESLLGYGDMLYAPAGKSATPQRIHGAFIDDQETDRLTSYLRAQDRPQYEQSITTPIDVSAMGTFGLVDSNG